MRLQVHCYSGRKADERPVRFRLDEHEYLVEEVLDQWYGPEAVFYKIRANDGDVYILDTKHRRLVGFGILCLSGGSDIGADEAMSFFGGEGDAERFGK